MNEFFGKKLLILGAYNTEREIIDEARRMGLHTIVTDNHLNHDDAPAKDCADEYWDISWTDYPALCAKARERGVDGVMAGFSENRVIAGSRLCEELGLPFYAHEADIHTICNKDLFKEACKDCGIRVPKRYLPGDEILYPVIVKPTDNGGSKGITVCRSGKELLPAIEKAKAASLSDSVIIEEYITAPEIMVYFTVHNGIADVSAMCDRYMQTFDSNITQLPVAYVYPSKYLSTFEDHNLEKFRALIRRLRIRNGLIAFQSFVCGNDVFPFDPTYRLDGTMAYHITDCLTGVNDLRMLIEFSLTGSMGDDARIHARANPHFGKIGLQFPILLSSGTISRLEGVDLLLKNENVIHWYQSKYERERLERIADFSQMLGRVHMCFDDIAEMRQKVGSIYDLIKVFDQRGNSMRIGSLPQF